MAGAVEVGAETVKVIADGLEVVLGAVGVVPLSGVFVSDVGSQLEVLVSVAVGLAGLAVCTVDAVGQEVELAGIFYNVGVAFRAFSSPGDGDEGGRDGHVGGGHGDGVFAIVVGTDGVVARAVVVGNADLVVALVADKVADKDDLCAVGGYMVAHRCRLAVGGDGDGGGTAGDGQVLGEGNEIAWHGAVVRGDVGFVTAYAGGVHRSVHGAGGVVVALEGAAVHAADGAVGVVLGGGHGGADGEVVAQGAVVVVAHDAAKVLAVGGVGEGEGGGAGAVADGAVVRAHNAAVVVGIVLHGADGYVVGHVAAAEGATVAVDARDAAGVPEAGDASVGEGEVVDIGAVSCIAEDALEAVGVATAALVDADAADGVAVAIEVAHEGAVVVVEVASDGLEVVLGAVGVVPLCVGFVVDVVGELEVLAAVAVGLAGLAVCAVDAVGQKVELAGVFYEVGVAFRAFSCPGDGGEGGRDGHVGGGHGENVFPVGVGTDGMVARTVVVGDAQQVVALALNDGDLCAVGGYIMAHRFRLAVGGDGEGGDTAGDRYTLAESNEVAWHGAVVHGDIGDGRCIAVFVVVAVAYADGVYRSGHGAGGVVVVVEVVEFGSVVIAANGTIGVFVGGGYSGANDKIVVQIAVVGACYTADVVVATVGGVGVGEGDGAGAVADHAAVVIAHDAAVVAGIFLPGADGYVVGHVAVDDLATLEVAHDAAEVKIAGDAGIGEGEAVDIGTASCIAEDAQTEVSAVIIMAAPADADAADGVAGTFEVAMESEVIVSDGLEVVLGARDVPGVGVAVGDVVGELEVLAAVAVGLEGLSVCAVDSVGQEVEVVRGLNQVRVVQSAATIPCPRSRGSEHHHE